MHFIVLNCVGLFFILYFLVLISVVYTLFGETSLEGGSDKNIPNRYSGCPFLDIFIERSG